MIRKQLTFSNQAEVKTIEDAVEKLNKEAKDGQIVSVNRFIAEKALQGALTVLKRKK